MAAEHFCYVFLLDQDTQKNYLTKVQDRFTQLFAKSSKFFSPGLWSQVKYRQGLLNLVCSKPLDSATFGHWALT